MTSEALNKEALSLACTSLGAIRIQERLSEVADAARHQRVYGELQPIESAPTLWTFNRFGFKLYGRSDEDSETSSYLTTCYFVALFVPIFPIARYRIRAFADNRYSFLGKAPLRKLDRWHLGIALIVVVAWIFGAAMTSESSPRSGTASNSQFIRSGTTARPSSPLPVLKARIDQGREQSSALESQLQPVITQLREMNEQLKRLRSGG